MFDYLRYEVNYNDAFDVKMRPVEIIKLKLLKDLND